jgi:hypothetical protein
MTWFVAMGAVLLFMLVQKAADGWPAHKLRTWAAMFLSSVAGWIAVGVYGGVPVLSFIIIDILAGVAVLARPAGLAQRAIGLCYGVMILSHIGYKIALLRFDGVVSSTSYEAFMTFAGWAQLVILTVWSGWDVGRAVLHRVGLRRAVVDKAQAGGTRR